MSDLIDRQAAIDQYGDWYVEEGTAEGFISDMRHFLEMLPSAEPQWIPVSERLPKETGIYLVTLKTDGVAYFEDEFPHGFVYASAYEAVTMHWGYCDKNVIAWMPLPEPYEGDKE